MTYRQSTIVNRQSLKLSAKFFGLYRVLKKIGAVACKLELSDGSRVHPVFHVSQLKLHIGPVVSQCPLPLITEEGVLDKKPVSILDRRLVNKHGLPVTEVLVRWKNSFLKDFTWENFTTLMQKYPVFHP